MSEEEIKVMIKDCVYSEDGITYMSNKQYNNYINIIKQLEKENKKYKEVIDKAIEYMKNNATSNYFDKEKNMFRREEDLLKILKEVE